MSERTVLIVEPDAALSSSLREMLEAAGYNVAACGEFREAREYLSANSPDAIVTNVRLGAYNGLHVVLLAKRRSPALPAFVYSGREDAGIEPDAANWGATYVEESSLAYSLIPQLNARLPGNACMVRSSA